MGPAAAAAKGLGESAGAGTKRFADALATNGSSDIGWNAVKRFPNSAADAGGGAAAEEEGSMAAREEERVDEGERKGLGGGAAAAAAEKSMLERSRVPELMAAGCGEEGEKGGGWTTGEP